MSFKPSIQVLLGIHDSPSEHVCPRTSVAECSSTRAPIGQSARSHAEIPSRCVGREHFLSGLGRFVVVSSPEFAYGVSESAPISPLGGGFDNASERLREKKRIVFSGRMSKVLVCWHDGMHSSAEVENAIPSPTFGAPMLRVAGGYFAAPNARYESRSKLVPFYIEGRCSHRSNAPLTRLVVRQVTWRTATQRVRNSEVGRPYGGVDAIRRSRGAGCPLVGRSVGVFGQRRNSGTTRGEIARTIYITWSTFTAFLRDRYGNARSGAM